jgi:hypothetical protein
VPATLEVEMGGLWFGKKLTRLPFKKVSQMLFTPIIPGTRDTEVGGLQSEAGLGRRIRPYLKNKL